MQVHEKIRQMRVLKGWSQEDMADRLQMSVNGYANIERGETDVQASRLEQIAKLFGMDLMELFSFGERNTVFSIGDNNTHHTQNILCSQESVAFELQKCQLLLQQKDLELEHQKKEIAYLQQIVKLLRVGKDSEVSI